ncbi:hypothetical protein [Methylobacterium frigidaeris]|uniref:Uncharacterized protein n=1 Tax=Methylobacterium frigidaeris TaxID=2038277 RepID=A0AA37HH87_9HYPH|nr:hypothetical protein [Methylobacterium frigidaeris]GJD65774.1 hypothetical protein MPEAHAMD_5969 [Methylobacterium frigidaeris]
MASAGTVWMKNGYLKGELDPATDFPVPGAIEPGIYWVDRETYRAFSLDPRISRIREERLTAGDTLGYSFEAAGATVRIATAEQRAWFERMEAEGRAKELPDA